MQGPMQAAPDITAYRRHWAARFGTAPYLPTSRDRKSTRLNSSHVSTSYAVFCLKKKTYRDLTPREAVLAGILRRLAGVALARPHLSALWRRPARLSHPRLPRRVARVLHCDRSRA